MTRRHIVYGATDTPLGPFWLALGEGGVVRAGPSPDGGAFARLLVLDGFIPSHDPDEVAPALRQIEEYFGAERQAFDLTIDIAHLTPFQQAVLHAVRPVPFGTVRSYRDIAETVGRPLGARAVGGAIGRNPISLIIPCHRIVKSDGSMGYFATRLEPDRGIPRKLFLLGLEGVHLPRTAPDARP